MDERKGKLEVELGDLCTTHVFVEMTFEKNIFLEFYFVI